jgi:hypothetical protein
MASGIYRIRVERGDKPPRFYVGQAVNLDQRRRQHFNTLARGRHRNIRLQRAYDKYGPESFYFEVLIVCAKNMDILLLYEQSVVDFLGTSSIYNLLTKCVGSWLGATHSVQSRIKIGMQSKARTHSPETKAIISAASRAIPAERRVTWKHGQKHTQETRSKLSKVLKGKPKSKEHIEKMRINGAIRMTVPGAKEQLYSLIANRLQSQEERAKRSLRLKGRRRPPEVGAKISASKKGKPKSPEHRISISLSQLGRVQSVITRAKRSESLKKFNAARKLSFVLEAM